MDPTLAPCVAGRCVALTARKSSFITLSANFPETGELLVKMGSHEDAPLQGFFRYGWVRLG